MELERRRLFVGREPASPIFCLTFILFSILVLSPALMNCETNVPGTEPGVVAGEDKGEINVDSEVIDDPAGLETGGITLIVGGCVISKIYIMEYRDIYVME